MSVVYLVGFEFVVRGMFLNASKYQYELDLRYKKICIFGTGGFARETMLVLIDCIAGTGLHYKDVAVFIENNADYRQTEIMGVPVIRQSDFDVDKHMLIVAVGEPSIRRSIVEQFPENTEFATLIHPSAIISDWVEIGEGSVITAGTIITCEIQIGKHAHLNLNTTVGHDCVIGDYFTTAPGVNVSGICSFGDEVYFGTSSSVRQGINICSGVTIGMGSVVVKDINDSGTYVGIPARPLLCEDMLKVARVG